MVLNREAHQIGRLRCRDALTVLPNRVGSDFAWREATVWISTRNVWVMGL